RDLRRLRPRESVQVHNVPLDEPEPFVATELEALAHQQLESQADADDWLARGRRRAEGVGHPRLAKGRHRVAEGANTRKDDSVVEAILGTNLTDDAVVEDRGDADRLRPPLNHDLVEMLERAGASTGDHGNRHGLRDPPRQLEIEPLTCTLAIDGGDQKFPGA